MPAMSPTPRARNCSTCRRWRGTLTLLAIFDIPRAALPEVRLSSAFYGETVSLPGIPAGLPIAALIGDSHAALYGHAGFQPGAIKATYGTGSSLMTPTATRIFSQKGLSSSIAWGYQQATYALEGNIYVTGAAVQWLSDLLGLGGPENIEALAAQASRHRRRLFCSGAGRSGRALLERFGARLDQRSDARHNRGAVGASYPGVHCLPDS